MNKTIVGIVAVGLMLLALPNASAITNTPEEDEANGYTCNQNGEWLVCCHPEVDGCNIYYRECTGYWWWTECHWVPA